MDRVMLPAGAGAVRLVAVDMDGTLLDGDARVSTRALAAIAAAERAGVHFVIATGRRHSYAMRVLRELEMTPDNVLITSNGAVVRRVDARLIETTHLPISTARWLMEHMREFRNAMVLTFDRVGTDGDDARGALVVEELEDLHRSIEKWMIANAPYIQHVDRMEDALGGDAPIQLMICGTVERMRRAEARLLEDPRVVAVGRETRPETEVQLARTEYPERDLSIVDILPAGCSKGAAVMRFAASQGVKPGEMMAIGDNWNDLSMLEVVGYPVVMENAPEDFLAVALERGWFVAPKNTEDGVARVVEGVLAGLER
jgi:hydroxymethylpyrimidine pyrophosphatase-like HAD family hydrolase